MYFSRNSSRTGESNLIDVLLHLLFGHPHAAVADRDRACHFIHADRYAEVTRLAFEFADGCKRFQLLRSIHGIGDDLTQEYLMVAVQEFFDDGEYIVARYPDCSFLTHSVLLSVNVLFVSIPSKGTTNPVPQGPELTIWRILSFRLPFSLPND